MEYTLRTKTWQKQTNILYVDNGDSIPKNRKCECTNEAHPLWFGLFLILIETWEQ